MPPEAQQVTVMNTILRGTSAIIMVVVVNRFPLIELLPDVAAG